MWKDLAEELIKKSYVPSINGHHLDIERQRVIMKWFSLDLKNFIERKRIKKFMNRKWTPKFENILSLVEKITELVFKIKKGGMDTSIPVETKMLQNYNINESI